MENELYIAVLVDNEVKSINKFEDFSIEYESEVGKEELEKNIYESILS